MDNITRQRVTFTNKNKTITRNYYRNIKQLLESKHSNKIKQL